MSDPEEDEDLFDTEDHAQGAPQDVDDLDDEMRELIGELDPEENYLVDRMVEDSPAVEGDSSPPLLVAANPEAALPPAPPKAPPATKEVRKLELAPVAAEEPPPPPPPEPPIVDIRKQFEQFNAVAEEVVQGTRHDRQEIQDGINLCRSEIQKAIGNGSNPSRMWVDNLGKMLEIKATVNLTAIKGLEAIAKLLAATKAGVQVQNNNLIQNANVATQADHTLVDLLERAQLQPEGEDKY